MARLRSLVLAFGGWACVHLLLMTGSGSTDFEAFALMAPSMTRPRGSIAEFVELVNKGICGDVTNNEKIPVAKLLSWPHWVVQPNMNPKAKLKAIPCPISRPHLAEEGWVKPFGFDQIWLVEGLPPPVAKLGISCIYKDGQLLYVAPALDLSISAANRTWRNRGTNSIGLAKRWMYANNALGKTMKLTGHVQKGNSWVKILDDGLEVEKEVRKLRKELDFTKSGYHIVTMPISGQVLQDELMLGHKGSFKMTLHFSESDAGEDQEKPILNSATLSVKVRAVESSYEHMEHLSKVYEPLYASA